MNDLPPGLKYEDDDAATLAAAYRSKPELNAIVRAETALALKSTYEALPRWRWIKRWRLRVVVNLLAREEEAYRASRSADR